MAKTILIKNATAIATLGKEQRLLQNAHLLIEGNLIKKLGEGDFFCEADEVLNAKDKVVVAGFVNTHHHFCQTLTRAFPLAINSKLFDWLINQYPVWAGFDHEAIFLSTQIALAELMLSGCTTSTNHHYLYPKGQTKFLDTEILAAKEIGIRFQPTRGSMTLGEKDGGLPPDSVTEFDENVILDSERLIQTYNDESFGSMLKIALAPCAPFNVSKFVMRESAKLAEKYGVSLHTHLAETEDETAYCLENFGCRPLDYLEEVGWLREKVWLAHGIFFNDAEIQKLAKFKIGIAHCPSSNARLGSGICEVNKLRKAGCPVGIGVDGSASNDSSNILSEIRQALLLTRVKYGAEAIKVEDVLEMATFDGAKCLSRDDIGKIEVGKCADLAIFDLNHLNYSGAEDPLGAIVLCQATTVDTLIVNGEIKIRNKEFVDFGLQEKIFRHREKAKKLLKKAGVL
ncbi:8-oxoguanine deaminase [bacterium]|nr:8-oxoguanine deaminase [bacterium]